MTGRRTGRRPPEHAHFDLAVLDFLDHMEEPDHPEPGEEASEVGVSVL
jgi:hypothetical protein